MEHKVVQVVSCWQWKWLCVG